MDFGPKYLAVPELSVPGRYPVNIMLGQWPHGIVIRDHPFDKLFQFARRHVIRHQPNADTRAAIDNSPGRIRAIWRGDIHAYKSVDHCLPTTPYVVVCVNQYANRLPSRDSHLVADGGEKGIFPSLVRNVELAIRRRTFAEMDHNVLVVGAFDQQYAWLR